MDPAPLPRIFCIWDYLHSLPLLRSHRKIERAIEQALRLLWVNGCEYDHHIYYPSITITNRHTPSLNLFTKYLVRDSKHLIHVLIRLRTLSTGLVWDDIP